jgi:hypothetical protein
MSIFHQSLASPFKYKSRFDFSYQSIDNGSKGGNFEKREGLSLPSCYPQTAGFDENAQLQPVILRSF